MAEQKYIDFINKIISETKNKKIKWKYLDNNIEICEGMGWTKKSIELPIFSSNEDNIILDFNREDSFYSNIKNTYIVIYVWRNQPAKLYVIPSTYKKVVELSPEEYGAYITRLLNIVTAQFPDGEKFIDDLLNDQI